jgi:hypothetical protein
MRVAAGFEVFRREGAPETVPLTTKTGGSENKKASRWEASLV